MTSGRDPAWGAVRAAIADQPLARAALAAILDRREATGRWPGRITVAADAASVGALRAIFSARAVVIVDDARVRIELGRVPPGVEALLYAALDRGPRDPGAERSRLQAELAAGLAAVPAPRHPVTIEFLASARAEAAGPGGEVWELAERAGWQRAAAICAQTAVALDAVLGLAAPVRIANFAARVLGDSKALAPGTDLARWLATMLLRFDPATQLDVAAAHPASYPASLALALDCRGLVRDEASVLVHAFGPLVYARRGVSFRHVADDATLGAPTPLSLAQLRDARVVELPIDRISIFENQAPFLDYVDRADPRRELVVFARGQATWAVVTLLRMCATPGVAIRHAGDLDRSGVLILRSLARRTRLAIEPWHMDAATHARFVDRAGRALEGDERDRVARLIATDDPAAPGHDLLAAIHASGRWIEQEAISDTLWIPPLSHAPPPSAG